MNVTLHIERLILDGLPVEPRDSATVQAAIEAELTQLLASGGLGGELRSGGAVDGLRTANIRLPDDGSPYRTGEQIAGAVYGGIGK